MIYYQIEATITVEKTFDVFATDENEALAKADEQLRSQYGANASLGLSSTPVNSENDKEG